MLPLLGNLYCCEIARADAASWTLRWSAPSDCPNERAVRQQVESWLAQSLAPNDARGIRVDAAVERNAEGFVLELELETPSGSGDERLTAERCDTLAGVVALKVALAADPGWPSSAARDESAHGPSFGLRLSAGLGSGVLPAVGPLFELTGTLRLARVELDLGAGYGVASDARYPELPAVGAEVALFYASPRACVLPEMEAPPRSAGAAPFTVEFPVCVGADIGLMRGDGFGTPEVLSSSQLYAALVVAPALRWPWGRKFSLWFGVDALVSVVRPTFHVRNLDRLFVPQRIGARVKLGGELHFE